jgi:very-short-patch-repair endonuclease
MTKDEREQLLCELAVELMMQPDCEVELEWRFHDTRKWRFDLALPEHKIALEVEGGTWISGRHNRPVGYAKDMEKYNEAALLGWRVLRCTWKEVKNGEALALMLRALGRA